MKKKLLIKNQRGSMAIIGIILTMIAVTVIGGYISLNRNFWTRDELQSVIDIASLNALNNSIDETKLRNQIFAVKGTNASIDTKQSPMKIVNDSAKMNTVLANNFQTELNKQISVNSMIESIKVKQCVGTLSLTDWGTNGSSAKKARPQLSLDAIIQVVIKNSAEFDTNGIYNMEYKDAKTGNVMTVQVNDIEKDGKVTLTVRSLSRIVYR